MPWRETCSMNERMKFVCEYLGCEMSMAALCRQYGVSRRTGYKWVARHASEGIIGLQDRSRVPHGNSRSMADEMAAMIVNVRQRYPTWGPPKVRAWLMQRYPDMVFPASSTIGALFDRVGLTVPRPHRQRVPARTAPLSHCRAPNDVWSIDFKGWFLTDDGSRCDPLTMQDADSRYLLRCRVMPNLKTDSVWPHVEVAFRAYGLPRALRSDNGAPFAGRAVGGLSRLAVNVIKAGVMPERIAPGKPQQNGRHERMHLTLKQDTASPPAHSLRAQQRRFNEFQKIYNDERPHQALGNLTPGQCYQRSPRTYDGKLRSPVYGDSHQVRMVRRRGNIRWRGDKIFISEVLIGEPVGLLEQEDGQWLVQYGPIDLGHIDHKSRFRKPTLWK